MVRHSAPRDWWSRREHRVSEDNGAPRQADNKPPDTTAAASATAQSRGGDGPPSGAPCEAAADPDPRPPIKFTLGERVTEAATIRHFERKIDDPVYRPLKIYTIDPS